MREKRHSNRFKRMRAAAKLIAKTTKVTQPRGWLANWWKLARGMDYSMREKFVPPAREEGSFERMWNHLRGDYSAGWPDPANYRVWMVVRNSPRTVRFIYRRLKAQYRAQVA